MMQTLDERKSVQHANIATYAAGSTKSGISGVAIDGSTFATSTLLTSLFMIFQQILTTVTILLLTLTFLLELTNISIETQQAYRRLNYGYI
jgi:hypothetical protein